VEPSVHETSGGVRNQAQPGVAASALHARHHVIRDVHRLQRGREDKLARMDHHTLVRTSGQLLLKLHTLHAPRVQSLHLPGLEKPKFVSKPQINTGRTHLILDIELRSILHLHSSFLVYNPLDVAVAENRHDT